MRQNVFVEERQTDRHVMAKHSTTSNSEQGIIKKYTWLCKLKDKQIFRIKYDSELNEYEHKNDNIL